MTSHTSLPRCTPEVSAALAGPGGAFAPRLFPPIFLLVMEKDFPVDNSDSRKWLNPSESVSLSDHIASSPATLIVTHSILSRSISPDVTMR